MSYFEDIFLKNVDIWGFIMIYISLYEYLYDSFDELNEYQMEFITKIKYIIIHFLYESPISPIDISSLVNELTSLNKVIEKFEIDHSSRKLEYVSTLEDSLREGGFLAKQKREKNIKQSTSLKKTHKIKHVKKQKTKKRR